MTLSPLRAAFSFLVVSSTIVAAVPNALEVVETVLLAGVVITIVILATLRGRGNEQGLTQELADIEYRPATEPALERGIAEAQRTLDAQINNLNEVDTKAIRILRVNVLSLGVILSALAVSSRAQAVSLEGFLNAYFGAGVFLLVSSTATAALTYTASEVRAGMSSENVVTMLREDLTDDELELVLAKSYAKWIHDDQSTEVLNAFYSMSTILLLTYAAAYLSLGVYRALVEPVPLLFGAVTTVALVLITLISGYPTRGRQILY